MSFTGDGQRLVGNDGTIYALTPGTEVTGDGATPIPSGAKVIVSAIGSPSGFPGTSGATGATQIGVGRFIEIRDVDTPIVPETGDKYVPVTLSELCDISSWQLPSTADEIEVSTFCDEQKKYRSGKVDASGQFSGIFTIGTTDDVGANGLARRFMDIIRQDGGDSIDVYESSALPIIAELVLQKNESFADIMSFIAPIELFGISIGAEQGANPQGFDSSFRLATKTVGAASVEIQPALYRFSRGELST
jgi:hypothetical protein